MNADFQILPEAVKAVSAADKPAILRSLAGVFASAYGLDAEAVFSSLNEREQLGSTGFGRGVAIPHARMVELKRPIAACLRLDQAVDFAAADGLPVKLVFGLVSPTDAGAAHLHALASISRLLRDDAVHEALSKAPDEEALRGLLTNLSDRDAA